jgi:hypothetical protein
MTTKDEDRGRVRLAVQAEMAARGWNVQDLMTASRLDRKTITTFLEGERWPQTKTLGAIEKAVGWWPGSISAMLAGHSAPPVGGATQDADYVAAPGERVEPGAHDDEVLAELRAMREDINALSRRVARVESGTEPLGGTGGEE